MKYRRRHSSSVWGDVIDMFFRMFRNHGEIRPDFTPHSAKSKTARNRRESCDDPRLGATGLCFRGSHDWPFLSFLNGVPRIVNHRTSK